MSENPIRDLPTVSWDTPATATPLADIRAVKVRDKSDTERPPVIGELSAVESGLRSAIPKCPACGSDIDWEVTEGHEGKTETIKLAGDHYWMGVCWKCDRWILVEKKSID